MITRKKINKAIGEFIDNALDAYGLHAVRRSVDSPDVIDRRSVRIILEGTRLEPASGYRIVHQEAMYIVMNAGLRLMLCRSLLHVRLWWKIYIYEMKMRSMQIRQETM